MALVEIEAGPAPDHRGDHARRGRGARAGRGRAGDRGGQGDVGDGRARMRLRPRPRCAARCCSPSRLRRRPDAGGDSTPQLTVSAAASLKQAFTRVRQAVRRRRRRLLLRRLRRARRADRAGRQARRVRRRQHQAARCALRQGPGREADRVRRQPARAGGAGAGRDRSTSLEDLERKGVKLAVGAKDVPVGSYTRDGARQAAGGRSARRSSPTSAPRSPTWRASPASSPRARSTPASSTPPTSRATDDKLQGDRAARRTLQPTVAYGVAVVEGRQAAGGGEGVHRRPARRRRARRRWRTRASCRRRRSDGAPGWFAALLVAALTLALLFLTLPVVAIFVDTAPRELIASLGEEGALEALRLSLLCSGVGDRVDRAGRHAGRLLARHAALPRPRRWSSR